MPKGRRRIYWDSNCWLSLINAIPDRVLVLDSLLADSKNELGDIDLVTSSLSIVEVAFAQSEQQSERIDQAIEDAIDSLWADRRTITLIEYHDLIGLEARTLIRTGLHRTWNLKPMDAVHLATAKWFSVDEFHTYDKRLIKEGLSTHLGFPIKNPRIIGLPLPEQSQLPISEDSDEAR